MKSKIFQFFALAIIVVLGIVFYGQKHLSPENKTPITIGAVLHLTGDQAETAKAFREGIELAADEINKSGGIKGQPLNLVIEDSKLQPKDAHSAAVKLIEIDKVDAAIDASFLEIMANGKLFNDAKVPVVTLWDSSKSIEDIGPHVFGIGIWTPSAGEKSADFAYNKLRAKKAVVINIQNEWSQAVSQYFEDKFEGLGGTVVETFTLLPNTKDFRTTISKIKALNVDVVYAPVTDGVVPFYDQFRQLNVNKAIITSDIITGEHIAASPQSFENVYQTQASDPESASTQAMVSEYRQKFGHEPKQVLFTAWGYDAVKILARTFADVGTDSKDVIDYLHSNVKDYQGASGVISINEKGSSPKLENMFQIRSGIFVRVD